MKRGMVLLSILILASIRTDAMPDAKRGASLLSAAGSGDLPLYFIANRGQAAAEVLFYAQTPGTTLWLTRHSLVCGPARMVFKDAKPKVAVAAIAPADYRVSYFEGKNEAAWHTDIPTSKTVLYSGLYDGIDLKVYGRGGEIEYDWIVRPGSDPSLIRFAFENARRTRLSRDGDLVVETEAGRCRHRKPSGYQIIEGTIANVGAAFREVGNGEYGFSVEGYDGRYDLVIDPLVLVYSTYLGGIDKDVPAAITVDAAGAVYIGAFTNSKDFPPGNVNRFRRDAVITKISPDGADLIYSAFFPAAINCEKSILIAVDGQGSVYAAGCTDNPEFPVKNAYQNSYRGGSYDGFFLKLAPSGKSLVFSSYLGGRGSDYCNGLAEDGHGLITVAGNTDSGNFPAKNAFQETLRGRQDGFVTRIGPTGRSLVFSTFLGSSGWDYANDIAVDESGAAYITGRTGGYNFPLRNAFQKTLGGGHNDAYVTKLAPAGNEIIFSSYLGGSGTDIGRGIALDADGAVYVTGDTTGGSFPVRKAFQKSHNGGSDGFVTKVSPDGKSLVYSTFLGGLQNERATGIVVDGEGAVYVVGDSDSRNFPVQNPYQGRLKGKRDGFLTVLASRGQSLLYSTFLGGSLYETVMAAAVDGRGGIYLTGYTESRDFPLATAYQKKYGGGTWDGFVLKFKMGDS